jgi:hypothetical protein
VQPGDRQQRRLAHAGVGVAQRQPHRRERALEVQVAQRLDRGPPHLRLGVAVQPLERRQRGVALQLAELLGQVTSVSTSAVALRSCASAAVSITTSARRRMPLG